MGFKFSFLCDLLSSLEENRITKTASKPDQPNLQTIRQWFARHDRHINHEDTNRLALLSCMFPEKRTDRVFWLQATSLARVIGRCLGLGSSRLSELDQWRESGGPDLGKCVENVMRQAENYVSGGREVTTEEIDHALGMIASRCRFSRPQVRRTQTAVDVESSLSPLYRRLSSRDAKWLTRMILKSYAPVVLPLKHTLERFHFLLPHLLQFQDTFEGALEMLDSEPFAHFPPRPESELAASLCATALGYLRPRTGIKIGRPEYFKARSIKHCHQMANGRRISVERKYDGEYCQIHVDLTHKRTPVQIFSKSGKDSTEDRSGIIPVIEDSLRIGSSKCRFIHRCILEGELVVWSDKREGIAGFHKLRKFLSRSGTLIGVDSDSPSVKPPYYMYGPSLMRIISPQPYEHLMIVFFDILLLDDDVCLRNPHRQRRLLLQDVVQRIHGRADLAEQEILDFGRPGSQERIGVSFAKAIAQRWEGYVLKACDEPYFPIYSAGTSPSFGRWIKLKKDYVQGLGDTVDLALIGAYYDYRDAAALPALENLKWTHFLVGCLLNKDAVLEFGETPRFRVVDALNHHCMHKNLLRILNHVGQFSAREPEYFETFSVEYGRKDLSEAAVFFKKPFVVELMGSGFEKPSGARYFALRFPRILKIYTDRTFDDAASFQELQLLADDARSIPTDELSTETEQWRKRLKMEKLTSHYIIRRSQSPSSSTCSSISDSEADSASGDLSTAPNCKEVMQVSALKTGHAQPLASVSTGGHDQTCEGPKELPAVYIDESASSPASKSLSCDGNVLTENENLSYRQNSSQRRRDNIDEAPGKETNFANYEAQANFEFDISSTSQNNRLVPNARRSCIQSSNHPQAGKDTRSNHHNILRSPLMTIPVYMTGRSSETDAGLMDFIRALNSDESRVSLAQSNPRAVEDGTAFGLVLSIPSKTIIGQDILRVGHALKVLSDSFRHEVPDGLTTYKIFFLNAAILAHVPQPEDEKFCLQETWSRLGPLFFYACACWDLGRYEEESAAGIIANANPCATVNTSSFKLKTSGDLPSALSVTFLKSDILALGECTSAERAIE
ncbi:hypothetical protein N7532_007741 [Penicillium argentinense]|uniref:ATP-dependent DNA ligase family profile domain-containing protein n=1 Tax=Penicillium argentinense TaxID=1131581 RepID=A0A9W9K1V3_9EURO|nr:uncharacterized protein N7532_007741 [Penicillium argentinense]KAJ5089057.1 hypothetical protein N7532_007741 [Penicillium argentinense]